MSIEKIVYHGSYTEFDSPEARPKRNVRTQPDENGEMKVVFDQESFHATPHKWIALAYTCHRAPYEIDGKTAHHGMGVDLYGDDQTVVILGFGSLEESLQKMYGDGGFVYHFGKDKFLYKEGLGDRELIAEESVNPVTVERVDNPVEEMKKLGVSFMFVDLWSSRKRRPEGLYGLVLLYCHPQLLPSREFCYDRDPIEENISLQC